MKRRTQQYNPKRRILGLAEAQAMRSTLQELASRARYGGNPEHKRNPGGFALEPPAGPRPGKSLCDDAGIFRRRDAETLLRAGFHAGLVSDRFDGEWPYNVWVVTDDGVPMEAQLERQGVYHGYPMPTADPFRDQVLKRFDAWSE